MSRTVRRKNGFDRCDNYLLRKLVWFTSSNRGDFIDVDYLEGKAKEKGLAMYHTDKYVCQRYTELYPKSSRRLQHKIQRARVSSQLARFKKDAEHEVIVRKNPHLNYWH